jgi:hypothetical protein
MVMATASPPHSPTDGMSGVQCLVLAIRAEALSYLPKTAGVDQVIDAVRAAARGEIVLQPAATARLLRELRHASADPIGQLTPRETDVLKGLGWRAAAPTARSPEP